jgi:catechol 2,3-dioxygenase-like lactoylglutathione lyase family enzyme
MANVRDLVHDVDAALAFYTGPLGFELAQRWRPPFAMVRRGDLTLWLSGPGGRQLVVDDPSGNPVELFEPQRT